MATAATPSTIMRELAEHYTPIMRKSPDGIYLWLDEHHAICNAQLARMLGWTLEDLQRQVWKLSLLVAEEDRILFTWNYAHRIANLIGSVTFRFRASRKDGTTFSAETDMIPTTYQIYTIVYHFVRKIGE